MIPRRPPFIPDHEPRIEFAALVVPFRAWMARFPYETRVRPLRRPLRRKAAQSALGPQEPGLPGGRTIERRESPPRRRTG